MASAVRAVGLIVALLGGAALFASLVGPQYPLMATAAPRMGSLWRKARTYGFALLFIGVAFVLLSLL